MEIGSKGDVRIESERGSMKTEGGRKGVRETETGDGGGIVLTN